MNEKNHLKGTALFMASMRGHLDLCLLFLEKTGADISKDLVGESFLTVLRSDLKKSNPEFWTQLDEKASLGSLGKSMLPVPDRKEM